MSIFALAPGNVKLPTFELKMTLKLSFASTTESFKVFTIKLLVSSFLRIIKLPLCFIKSWLSIALAEAVVHCMAISCVGHNVLKLKFTLAFSPSMTSVS